MSDAKKKDRSDHFRATPARGVVGEVDREKGIIYGLAITTEGEAKGHGVHLDSEFVQATVENTNAKQNGLKSRFGHPNMSSTAFGTYVGRIKDAWLDSASGIAIARGNLHLSESAKKSPNGDIYDYILTMAENDPDQFGTSIVFERGNEYKRDIKGNKVYAYNRDGSYNEDWKNIESKLYVEQKKLWADDIVDDPAANPDGLFSAFSADQPAAVVTEFLDNNPAIFDMLKRDDIDQIFDQFRERYEAHLESFTENKKTKEAPQMADETKNKEQVEITAEYLSANHPELVASFQAAGAAAERERLSAIDETAIPGHEDLVASAKADSSMSAGDLALMILKAEKKARTESFESLKNDAVEPVKIEDDARPSELSSADEEDKPLTAEEQIKSEWEADAELRESFAGGIGAYTALRKAEMAGRVKNARKKGAE